MNVRAPLLAKFRNADVTALFHQIEELEIDIESASGAIDRPNVSSSEYEELSAEIRSKVSGVRKLCDEMRHLGRSRSPQDMVEIEKVTGRLLREMSAHLQKLDGSSRQKASLISEAAQQQRKERDVISDAHEAIDSAFQVQNESMKAVQRGMKIVNQTEDVGTETATALKAQTEQMKTISADIRSMDSDLARATVLAKHFLKTAMTDKIAMCMIFFIVCLIIALIIYKIIHH